MLKLALLGLLTLASVARSQDALLWQRGSGLTGGRCVDIAIGANGTLFAASWTELYRSTDSGEHWELAWKSSVTGETSQSLRAVQRGHDGSVYALTASGRFARSTDDGVSWTVLQLELDGMGARKMLASQQTPELVVTWELGMLLSTDNGATWARSTRRPWSMAFGPGGTLYVCAGRRVFASTGGHTQWDSVDVPPGFQGASARLLVTPNGVLLLLSDAAGYRSTDAGVTWQQLDTTLVQRISLSDALVQSDGAVLAVGSRLVGRSTDDGLSWDTSENQLRIYATRIQSDSKGVLYAATPYGVLMSSDTGRTWQLRDSGYSSPEITALCESLDRLFAASYGQLVSSSDLGRTWSSVSSWKEPESGLARTPMSCLAITPRHTLITDNPADGVILRYSTDFGRTWVPRSPPFGVVSVVKTAPDGSVYIAMSDRQGEYFRSTDDGTIWTAYTVGGGGATLPLNIFAIAVDPSGRTIVGGPEGVFESIDGGYTWTVTGDRLVGANSIVLVGSDLLVGGTSGQVYRLSRGTGRWERLHAPNDTMGYTKVGLTPDGTIVAAGRYRIIRSVDGGATWEDISAGVDDRYIYDFHISNNGYMYVAAMGGVYRAQWRTSSVQRTSDDRAATSLVLRPNPIRGAAVIELNLATTVPALVRIVDVTGRTIATLAEGPMTSGRHTLHWSSATVADGIYFCHARLGTDVIARSVVVAR